MWRWLVHLPLRPQESTLRELERDEMDDRGTDGGDSVPNSDMRGDLSDEGELGRPEMAAPRWCPPLLLVWDRWEPWEDVEKRERRLDVLPFPLRGESGGGCCSLRFSVRCSRKSRDDAERGVSGMMLPHCVESVVHWPGVAGGRGSRGVGDDGGPLGLGVGVSWADGVGELYSPTGLLAICGCCIGGRAPLAPAASGSTATVEGVMRDFGDGQKVVGVRSWHRARWGLRSCRRCGMGGGSGHGELKSGGGGCGDG